MSVEAITWALQQKVPHSSAKFVLVVMANCASGEDMVAWPSAAYICESTGQDQKTVQANLRRLREYGFIEDTGERKGTTRQVIVYRLKTPKNGYVKGPQKRNTSKNGTHPFFPPKTPNFPPKDPQFSAKDPQKRGTEPLEPLLEPSLNRKVARQARKPPESAPTWTAYATAFRGRYNIDPVRNQMVNSQMAAFVRRIGVSEAPLVAEFYLTHPGAYYATKMHSVGLLLADAEKLRAEWATRRIVTATQARQDEKTASNPFARIAQEMKHG